MPRFTLDYSRPPSPARRRTISPLSLLVFCLIVNGIVLAALSLLLGRENRHLRRQRDAHALRYDSLLATKLHADRLLFNARAFRAEQKPTAVRGRTGISNQQLIRP